MARSTASLENEPVPPVKDAECWVSEKAAMGSMITVGPESRATPDRLQLVNTAGPVRRRTRVACCAVTGGAPVEPGVSGTGTEQESGAGRGVHV